MTAISEFKGALSSGVLRNNRWQVVLNFPGGTLGTTTESTNSTLLARTTNVPSSTLGSLDFIYEGRKVQIPGDRTFEDFVVDFIGVQDYKIRNAFESWSELINGNESNVGIIDFTSYEQDITLNLLDTGDNIIKSYILVDAWPRIVSSSALDKGATDGFVTFSVTFAYNYFTSDGVTSSIVAS
jgi:hypothetical protein